MPDDLRIALIGAGAMGEAITAGLIRREVVPASQILASEPRAERRQTLQVDYQINLTDQNVEAARWGQVVILAIKPQMLPAVLPQLRGTLQPDALCISIIAGAPLATFVAGLEHPAVVRAIPNTPAQIGAGMTVWTAAAAVDAQQRAWAQMVLSALGQELFVEDEHYLDMATALSGSGPAYFFLILEAMIDAGVHIGFPRHIAETLVTQTMLGAVQYAQQSGLHPAQLRNAVTSPGGTTAAALSAMERGGLRTTLSDGVWAAYRRSAELGRQNQEEQ